MRFALTEMRRRPQRFVTATIILTLITVLLVFLGGLLDGLVAGSTNALAAQPGELMVFSADAQDTLARSRITPEQRARVDAVDGVEQRRRPQRDLPRRPPPRPRLAGSGRRGRVRLRAGAGGCARPPGEGQAWADASSRPTGSPRHPDARRPGPHAADGGRHRAQHVVLGPGQPVGLAGHLAGGHRRQPARRGRRPRRQPGPGHRGGARHRSGDRWPPPSTPPWPRPPTR